MANLPETETYEAGITQLETTTPALGGAGGPLNAPLTQLANRTKWLKAIADLLQAKKVNMGTGTGQGTNSVHLGWDGTGLRLTVDVTDLGRLENFPAGTKLLFPQNTAPPGWTKDTNAALNHAIRLTGGTAGFGEGSGGFTTIFASRGLSGSVNAHTLSWNEMPVHAHSAWTDSQGYHGHNVRINGNAQIIGSSLDAGGGGYGTVASWDAHGGVNYGQINADGAGSHGHNVGVGNSGSGWSHAHGLTLNNLDMSVAYCDVILATKA